MAQIAESRATFRIGGDDLDPDEVTELLGCQPNSKQTKGEILVAKKSGRERVARIGVWRLDTEIRVPECIDQQVAELLSQTSGDSTVWAELGSRFKIDLFVGLFMEETNEGCLVSANTLKLLGERGIALQLDVYAP